MVALRRHLLVHASAEGWREAIDAASDAPARACLRHWAAHDLPLVVTRQRPGGDAGRVALGLAAPAHHGRRRLAIELAPARIARTAEFPEATSIAPLLAAGHRAAWRTWCDAVARHLAAPLRVYGSHGWQTLTGLRYLHAASDIDLLLPVADRQAADAACEALTRAPAEWPRLDGELLFEERAGIAWREWQVWQRGRSGALLVKRLGGAALEAWPRDEEIARC